MAFDGIVTKAVTTELKNIIGYKIDKIYEPDKNTVLLGLYGKNQNVALALCVSSNNCRLHLTTNAQKNPTVAPNFCMLLRKHLIGYKIKNIYTLDLERIVFIDLENNENPNKPIFKKLIVELMGKHSNIILVNENDVIIDSMRHTSKEENSNRDIYPTSKYVFPKSQKNSFLKVKNFEEFHLIFSKYLNNENVGSIDTIAEIISNNFNGISLSFAQNIVNMLNISDISKDSVKLVWDKIQKILNLAINISDNQYLDIIINESGKDFYLVVSNSPASRSF